jgi:hypothetical protein
MKRLFFTLLVIVIISTVCGVRGGLVRTAQTKYSGGSGLVGKTGLHRLSMVM